MKLRASVKTFNEEHIVLTVTYVGFVEDQVRVISGYDGNGKEYKFKYCEEPFELWSAEMEERARLTRERDAFKQYYEDIRDSRAGLVTLYHEQERELENLRKVLRKVQLQKKAEGKQ